jgi:chemotaxis signal transduction protein
MTALASVVRTARAWLLDVGGGYLVAAGATYVTEYLLAPEIIAVPRTPVHCPGVLLWREQLLPIVDLGKLLHANTASTAEWRHAVVLAWQDAPGKPLRHGALVVRAAPFEAFITDDMACALPPEAPVFGQFANSCFSHEEQPIPVLDIALLFGRPLAQPLLRIEEEIQENMQIAEPAPFERDLIQHE